MPKRPKTPQEKKQLSLTRDRRNAYGENSKASRKSIPARKAKSLRSVRKRSKQSLTAKDPATDQLDVALTNIRPKEWRKTPDQPLGKHLQLQRDAAKRLAILHRQAAAKARP